MTITEPGPFERLVVFSLSEADIDQAKTSTARRISGEIKIAGFRPGKAPRPVVERTVGSARLRAEAIDDILPERVASVLDEVALEPAVSPALESLDESDDGVDVTVRVTLWPSLPVAPEHRGRTVTVMSPDVTDDEVQGQIDRMRAQYGTLEDADGPAEEDAYVTIDISATHDGVDVPEASASQLVYPVGSGRFIEGIDEALDGVSSGDTRTFEGVLPEGFGEAAGKQVSFSVTVTAIKRLILPELTDEWVQEVSEFESLSELEVNLEERMGSMKRQAATRDFREKALDQLVSEVDMEIPEALIRSEMEEIVHRFSHRLERDEISLADYLEASGIDQKTFLDDARSQADRSVRTQLVLEAVAADAGLGVTDDEVDAVIATIFEGQDAQEIRSRLEATGGLQAVSGDILRNKALETILEEASPVDADGNPVDLEMDGPASDIVTLEEDEQDFPDDRLIPAGIPLDEVSDSPDDEPEDETLTSQPVASTTDEPGDDR